jgi:hypothetical protein
MPYNPPHAKFTEAQVNTARRRGMAEGVFWGVVFTLATVFLVHGIAVWHNDRVETEKSWFSAICMSDLNGFTDADYNVCYAKTWERPILAIRDQKETWR